MNLNTVGYLYPNWNHNDQITHSNQKPNPAVQTKRGIEVRGNTDGETMGVSTSSKPRWVNGMWQQNEAKKPSRKDNSLTFADFIAPAIFATSIFFGGILLLTGCFSEPVEGSTQGSTDEDTTGTSGGTEGPTGGVSSGDSSGVETSEGTTSGELVKCNNVEGLCDIPYNEVVFPTSHMSHAALAYGFESPQRCQNPDIKTQLEHGIRAFVVTTHYNGVDVLMCNGDCSDGFIFHKEDFLKVIDDFLDSEGNENIVITIIYYEGETIQSNHMFEDYNVSGDYDIKNKFYSYDENEGWLTLGEMIQENKRVVLISRKFPKALPDWYHSFDELVWATSDDVVSPQVLMETGCEVTEGDFLRPLGLLNLFSWRTPGECIYQDALMNTKKQTVLNLITDCQVTPNFPVVQFYHAYGDEYVLTVQDYN